MAATITKQVIHGVYNDEVPLLEACRKLKTAGIKVKEVYSPFPIHGIDPIIGIPRTRLAICAFLYGLTGCGLATLMMWYMMISDWPTDVGGKPNWMYFYNIPAFIPITFESTVFCAGHGMALTYLLRCMLVPGAKAKNPDPRTTNDKFLIYLELTDDQASQAENVMRAEGAIEINHKGTVTEKLPY